MWGIERGHSGAAESSKQQIAGPWALALFAGLWLFFGPIEHAAAAGPFEQTVTVEITSVRGRGPNTNRAQFVEVTIDQTMERLDLLHGCMDLNSCPSHQINPLTCGPGSGSDPAMNDVTGRLVGNLIARASFSKDVPQAGHICDMSMSNPRVFGEIHHFHRFAGGSDTLVDHVNFAVELDGPAQIDTCHFQEGSPGNDNNASGLTFTIFADENQSRGNSFLNTDGDAFPDQDELHGVDTDCDGQADVLLNQPAASGGWHDVLPDPNRKDLYVEADWMDCNLNRLGETAPSCDPVVDGSGNPDRRTFEPDWTAFDDVVAAFAAHDITLHIMPDEAIPVMGKFNGLDDYALPDVPNEGPYDAQRVYTQYSGTAADRSHLKGLAYKQAHMRYAVFNYTPPGGGPHGQAFANGSDMFRVAFHPDFVINGNFWEDLTTPFDRRRELGHMFMHELGHALGIKHGGQDDTADKPNQFSVMTYRAPRLDDLSTANYDRGFDYNAIASSLDMCALSESAPIVPSAATNWATTWTCPDYAHRGSGAVLGDSIEMPGGNDWDCDGILGEVHSGSPGNANCLPLTDVKCVDGGPDGVVQTTAHPSDVYREARIWPGDDGVLDTPMAVDAVGNPLDLLTLDQEIIAGPDGVVDSHAAVSPNDDWVASAIHPGPDLVCDTVALSVDAQVVSPGEPNCGDQQSPAACREVAAVDEWALIQFAPRGNFTGAYQGPPLPIPVEPTPREREEAARASARADVGLNSSVAVGVGNHGRQADLKYDIVNFGPHAAVEPTVEVRLPEGTDLVRCHVPGGTCFQHGDRVVAGWDRLPSNETGRIEVEVLLGCDGSGGEEEVPARVHTVSYDPDPSNNQTLDSVVLEASLAIGEPGNPWVTSWTNGQLMPVVQSDRGPALALTCGYRTFESPAFDTYDLGAGGTQLLVDLYIPQASWGGWVGDLTLFFEAPGLDIWNRAQGTMALTPLAREQWITLAFPLDAVTRSALLTSTPSARFRLASNLSKCGPIVKLAHVRMGGTLTCQAPLPSDESITSSSVLRFESMADWSGPTGTVALENSQVTEGAHALRLGPASWMRIESRPFQSDELDSVSSRLALEVVVPELPAGQSWLGGLGLVVDCPGANLHDRWVGYHALQFLFGGEFNRLEYALPSEVVSVLETPDVECRFAFELSSNPSFGSFVLDGGGFLPGVQ